MLKSFYEQGLILYSSEELKWKWDASIFDINDINISRNVLELIRKRILSFDDETQMALKVLVCLGSPFSLTTLNLIVNKRNIVEKALSTGMITQYERSNEYYRFVHDQVTEAATSLLPDDRRELLYYIGKKLCFLFTSKELDSNIFTVVGILCYAAEIIEDQEERTNLAKLCMRAGERSMAMNAHKNAFDYLQKGIQLLPSDCWTICYDLSLNLRVLAVKAAYCVADYKCMNELIDKLSSNVSNILHLVEPVSLRIRFHNDKRMYNDAIHVALNIVEKMDRNVARDENIAIALNVKKVKCLLRSKSSDDILRRRANKTVTAIMMIFSNILSSAYFMNLKLLFFLSCEFTVTKNRSFFIELTSIHKFLSTFLINLSTNG